MIEPAHLISVLFPLLASLVFCLLAYKQTKKSSALLLSTCFVFLVGCFVNVQFAFWSERGLHVIPIASVMLIVWALHVKGTLLWVYPGTFFSILVTDIFVAYGKPGYPWGIGGAGILDSLYLMPMIFVLLAMLSKKLYNTAPGFSQSC